MAVGLCIPPIFLDTIHVLGSILETQRSKTKKIRVTQWCAWSAPVPLFPFILICTYRGACDPTRHMALGPWCCDGCLQLSQWWAHTMPASPTISWDCILGPRFART